MEEDRSNTQGGPPYSSSDPIAALKSRLARGEISLEEYEKTKKIITDPVDGVSDAGAPPEAIWEARLKSFDSKMNAVGRSYDALIAVGASVVGAYYLWKHRPVSGFFDGLERVAVNPDLVVLKEGPFFIGIVIVIAVFVYGLKKFWVPKS